MERKYFNINFKVDNTTENQEISNMEIEVKNQRPNANELFRKAINGSSRQATNAESEEYEHPCGVRDHDGIHLFRRHGSGSHLR